MGLAFILSSGLVALSYFFYHQGGELLIGVGSFIEAISSLFLTLLFTEGEEYYSLPDWTGILFNVLFYWVAILILMRIAGALSEDG